jgi:phosphatidylserine decarboxylase
MNRLFVTLQYLLPHHLLCAAVYALTRAQTPWFKDCLIRLFVSAYKPEMADALESRPTRYPSFNAFFTRALKADARPIDADPAQIVSPCDGTLSIAASLDQDRMLQAKGREFTLDALLAAQPPWCQMLRGGLYATIYLAPYNYHRLHMPLPGRLRAAWYVPGRLFSVNGTTVERVPGLFARNERVICAFDGEHGAFVCVLVGALFVGSMSTVWHGDITPWRKRARASAPATGVQQLVPSQAADLWQARGAELGRFNMGSTIVLLLPPGAAAWDCALAAGTELRMGQGIGTVRAAPPT